MRTSCINVMVAFINLKYWTVAASCNNYITKRRHICIFRQQKMNDNAPNKTLFVKKETNFKSSKQVKFYEKKYCKRSCTKSTKIKHVVQDSHLRRSGASTFQFFYTQLRHTKKIQGDIVTRFRHHFVIAIPK